jgi:hypothetical protein
VNVVCVCAAQDLRPCSYSALPLLVFGRYPLVFGRNLLVPRRVKVPTDLVSLLLSELKLGRDCLTSSVPTYLIFCIDLFQAESQRTRDIRNPLDEYEIICFR